MSHELPADAPPSYQQATGSSNASTRLQVPNARNNIPVGARRSMEDENRPLPTGWVRQFDTSNDHQFFVDTTKDPPRSIWHHPYDDEDYLRTLPSEERERIQADQMARNKHDPDTVSTDGSVGGDDHDDNDAYAKKGKTSSNNPPVYPNAGEGSSSQAAAAQKQEKPKLGRKLKDKLTGMTHEQRVAERKQRAGEEEEEYRQYLAVRGAMKRAVQTGQPQLVGTDRDGKEVYVEPPNGPMGGYGGYPGRGGMYVSPYGQQGPYANPNARFLRPAGPYARPYGRGYGGGYGLPLAGGLAGGLLLGGALGGFGM